jgi:hypothetical protein
MKISPQIKKVLSVCAATAAGILAAVLVKDEPQIIALVPSSVQIIASGAIVAAAHWLNTWGHAERVEDIATSAVAKANASVPPGAP